MRRRPTRRELPIQQQPKRRPARFSGATTEQADFASYASPFENHRNWSIRRAALHAPERTLQDQGDAPAALRDPSQRRPNASQRARQLQQQSQDSPRQDSRPSRTATAAITRAAAGSAHHQPKRAFASRPTRSAIEGRRRSCSGRLRSRWPRSRAGRPTLPLRAGEQRHRRGGDCGEADADPRAPGWWPAARSRIDSTAT